MNLTEPVNALEARMITEKSRGYQEELERVRNRIYRHIRGAAESGLFEAPLRAGAYVNEKDICKELKLQGYKIKTKNNQTWICW